MATWIASVTMRCTTVWWLLFVLSLHSTCSFRRPAVTIYSQHLRALHFSKLPSDSTESNLLEVINSSPASPSIAQSAEVNEILQNMPTADKYSLLLQSYGSKLTEENYQDDGMMRKMESLFFEMIASKISPEERSARYFLDAAASFCSVERVTQALKLLKAGGRLRAFGVVNGQLTTPVVSALRSQLTDVTLPKDNRETEVTLALGVVSSSMLWLSLQITGIFNEDIHPWSTLLACLLALTATLNVTLRQGQELKAAAKGIERLILRDDNRQAHVDAAGFLAGYLLGLPCYCYKPDLIESLKMLDDFPASLVAYQQTPNAAMTAFDGPVSRDIGGDRWDSLLSQLKTVLVSSPASGTSKKISSSKPKTISTANGFSSNEDEAKLAQRIEDLRRQIDSRLTSLSAERQLFGLGRVLVWLMAPVAAEQLKYGQTILSDPRRCMQLIEALDSGSQGLLKGKGSANGIATAGSSGSGRSKDVSLRSVVPTQPENKLALAQWAYFEATTLVKQYGDLLEEVSLYLRTGTSTVGECSLLVESRLT